MPALVPLDPAIFGPDSPCFGCSPAHPTGFRLGFGRDGDAITTTFLPGAQHQGPPGVMHGGLVLTVADELAAWTVIGVTGRFGFTASVHARLARPVRIGVEVRGTGRVARDNGRAVTVEVELTQEGSRTLRGEFDFVVLDERGAERVLGGPLPEAWKRFARGPAGPNGSGS